jgi:citrate synthase
LECPAWWSSIAARAILSRLGAKYWIDLDRLIDLKCPGMSRRNPEAPAPSEYLTAADAARLLRIKPLTLYTYVSRGLIRSASQPGRRQRLYYREDIDMLRARSEARHGRGAMAEGAMRWGGQPVINTSITEITAEGPHYRGRAAVTLAREGRSFEAVAELLWTGVLHDEPVRWDEPLPRALARMMDGIALGRPRLPMPRIYALATSMLGVAETAESEIRRGTTVAAARQLILALAGCVGYLGRRPGFRTPREGAGIAASVASAFFSRPSAQAVNAINQALVLCADHELSSSTFAARVAASTGAELRACVLAAIAAHSGTTLGGACDRAEDLLRDATTRNDVRQRLAATEQAGARVPGFNLPVYPKGDPRAKQLLQLAYSLAPQSARSRLIHAFIEEAEHKLQLLPSIEVGMVALAAALGLPERSASALWSLGRTAGWIAHVLEQRLAGFVLRPRARYSAAA